MQRSLFFYKTKKGASHILRSSALFSDYQRKEAKRTIITRTTIAEPQMVAARTSIASLVWP